MTLFRSLVTAFFLLIAFSSFAQTPGLVWAKNTVSGINTKTSMAVTVDGPGNVYTVGWFQNTVDLDPTATVANYSSVGMADTYITKLDVNGDLVWVRRIGTSGDDIPYSVSIDASGNVLISGQIQGTYDFDQGSGIANGNSGDYILKLNSSGDYVWVGTFGLGVSNTVLTTDDSGNVFATGTFFGTQDFDPSSGTSNITSTGVADIFVLQLTPSGSLTWARNMGGAGSSLNNGNDIAVDLSGFVYVTGYFSSTIDFDPDGGVTDLTSAGDTDAFVLKLSAAGEFEWVKQFGAAGGDQGKTIDIDLAGNLSAGGLFKNTVDFDPGVPSVTLTSDSNSIDYFIVRLTNNGNYIWAGRVGNFADEFFDTSAADKSGNVYFSGFASTTKDLDPGPGTFFNTSSGGYISKVDASGVFQWATFTHLNAGVSQLVISASDEIYLTGNFTGTRDFDPGSCVINLTSASVSFPDLFLEKLKAGAPPLCGATPTITSFTPGTGPVSTPVTIIGTNFSATPSFNEVRFNGVLATASASTATSIDVVVPSSATTGVITVKVAGTTATSATNFVVTFPPTITGFNPASGPVSTLLTITGTNFSTIPANNEVRFNGTLASVSFSTATSITTTVPSGATTGVITVKVSGLTATSTTDFTVTPAITNFTPVSGPVGTPVTIIGTNFSATPGDNEVRFNGQLASVLSSTATSIDTTVPSGATTGAITVKVAGSTATSVTIFTVTPAIISFAPASGFIGNAVVITGTNFSTTPSLNTVRFNGTLATVSSSTSTSITTNVPPSATTGVITVRVGTNTATSSTDFTVVPPPAPTIISFTPPSGPVGTSVTITGTDFISIPSLNEVRFNGTLASVSSSTTTSIITTVPSGATTGTITVTIAGNTATSSTDFTVTLPPPPTIISFTPPSGPEGTIVTLNGTNFSLIPADNEVRFNGTLAPVSSCTSTSIVTEVPVNAVTGTITVTVAGNTATSATDFIVTHPPSIISFTPASGPVGTSVTITGTNFITTPSGNTVMFNGTASIVSSSTSTTIVTEVPANATTGPITVSVTDGTATSVSDFIVTIPVITISSQPIAAAVCEGEQGTLSVSANGTTNLFYQWGLFEGNVFTPIQNGSEYSGVSTSTLTINTTGVTGVHTYKCLISGDNASSVYTDETALTINAIPTAPAVTNGSGCLPSSSVSLSATGGTDGQYRWYANAIGGQPIVGESNHTFITPDLSLTTTYYVSINNENCESLRTAVIASINFCNQAPTITPASTSISVEETAVIDLLSLINDVDNNIDPSSFKIIIQPTSGAPASITNSVLRINYSGIAFSGKDLLTIQACDVEGSCTQQELSIEVVGEVVVYNAVSPNGDTKNDFLLLQYIDIIEDTKENRVTILNRWGDVVSEINNYNNIDHVFTGLNKNGNELPSGTYFYQIQYASQRKSQTGYLYLKR